MIRALYLPVAHLRGLPLGQCHTELSGRSPELLVPRPPEVRRPLSTLHPSALPGCLGRKSMPSSGRLNPQALETTELWSCAVPRDEADTMDNMQDQ